MHRIAFRSVLLLFWMVASVSAKTHALQIEPGHTTLRFEVGHFLGKVIGRFRDVHGTVRIDPDNPENSALVAACAVRSIDTANATRDNHLRGELFEVDKFPEATFRSRKVVRTGNMTGDVTGDLTLHGATRPLVLHVTLVEQSKNSQGNEISRWRVRSDPFSRRTFGLTFSRGVETVSGIGDQVTLDIECETSAAD